MIKLHSGLLALSELGNCARDKLHSGLLALSELGNCTRDKLHSGFTGSA